MKGKGITDRDDGAKKKIVRKHAAGSGKYSKWEEE